MDFTVFAPPYFVQAPVSRDTVESRKKRALEVVALDSGDQFDEHILGNVLGIFLVVRDTIGGLEDGLVVHLVEHPQCL